MALLLAWEIFSRFDPPIQFFISMPSRVFPQLWLLIVHERFLYHMTITAAEALMGASIGTAIGAGIGLSLWYSRLVAQVVRPFALVAGAIPLIAFAPLFIVWFGVGFQMKAALAFYSTMFPTLAQAYQGAQEVSAEYVEVLSVMRARPSTIFQKVIVPGSLSWVLSSMRLNIGLGLLGAFLGEFIASQAGLGYIILRAAALYDVPRAFAAAAGIAVLAYLFDRAGRLLENRRTSIIELFSVPRSVWHRH